MATQLIRQFDDSTIGNCANYSNCVLILKKFYNCNRLEKGHCRVVELTNCRIVESSNCRIAESSNFL